MRILVLADRRTGHARQCEGLVRLIAETGPVEVETLPLVHARWANDLIRRLLAACGSDRAAMLLKRCYGIELSEVATFDLVIGSGRPTILAGLLLCAARGKDFVYSGRVEGYDSRRFARVLVPYKSDGRLPNHCVTMIPCPIARTDYAPPRPISAGTISGAHLALLVGGPSSRRGWSMLDWGKLAAFLLESEHKLGVRWSVATSQRTPEPARELLSAAFAALESGVSFVDYKVAGRGSVDTLYGADAVVVTSDSTSMIAEGLTAGRPVVGLSTARLKASRDDSLLEDLAQRGSFVDLPLATIEPEAFATALARLVPPAEDARDQIRTALAPVIATLRT